MYMYVYIFASLSLGSFSNESMQFICNFLTKREAMLFESVFTKSS